jgi:heme/copper-type cytochrome/quinol oxidase subunit 3
MIPYTVERRADTGVNNVTLGMWLFIASEAMLFAALFSAYTLLRFAAADWPAGRDVLSLPFAVVNTIVLLHVTAFAARSQRSTPVNARRLLLISAVFALAFLGIKGAEYAQEISAGQVPSTSTFFALYFTLTGFHAAHVIGGAMANAWVLTTATRIDARLLAGRTKALTLYWVFVDLIWLILVVLMYLT